MGLNWASVALNFEFFLHSLSLSALFPLVPLGSFPVNSVSFFLFRSVAELVPSFLPFVTALTA